MTTSTDRDTATLQHVSLDTIRATIAAALSTAVLSTVTAKLGDIRLLSHQQDAVARLQAVIKEFGGALLADDVGLGKTFVALAVASDYKHVAVIAPAGLLPMWRIAIARTQQAHVRVHSLHACSLRRPDIPAPVPDTRSLVIIDEAHALRTVATKRYRHIADAIGGHDTLLLSATPVHNSARELRAQLQLFLAARDDLLEASLLGKLVVRRDAQTLMQPSTPSLQAYPVPTRPRVHERAAVYIPHDPVVLSAILALPAPLPAHDGAVAGALVRMGLLRAWCSSDAALSRMITRRALRGTALREALRAGRHPTNVELRSWVAGDHEVQLAFPELMASERVEPSALLATLETHLAGLESLRASHHQLQRGDSIRAETLRELIARHPGTPIIAFSQFAATVHALYRALSDIAGIGMLAGTTGRIASGNVTRAETLARFAPSAQGVPPPPAEGAIRLLLATDLLAEGVNLQDAAIVVHLDLPWTDALLQQRVGRVARLGSPHAVVDVYRFSPPAHLERILRQLERVGSKARLAAALIGGGDRVESAADEATALHQALRTWRSLSAEPLPLPRLYLSALQFPWRAAVTTFAVMEDAWRWRALVLVAHRRQYRLLSCMAVAERNVVISQHTTDLLQRVHEADAHACCETARCTSDEVLRSLTDAVDRWADDLALRSGAGDDPSSLSSAQRKSAELIRTALFQTPAMRRGALAGAADRAMRAVRCAHGDAADRALEQWSASATSESAEAWLAAWMHSPVLLAQHQRTMGAAAVSGETSATPATQRDDSKEGRAQIRAIILFDSVTG